MQAQSLMNGTQSNQPQVMRVLIADDHEMILDIARMYLAQQGDMDVITAHDVNEALEINRVDGPFDVVVLDYNMPGMNGLDGLRAMIDAVGSTPVALITGNPTRSLMEDALEIGASGLISKMLPIKSLANAIRFIESGETYMPLNLMTEPLQRPETKSGPLSAREMTVLSYLGEGRKNKEIANSLGLSEGTVKMHVMSICKKLEVSNRTQAVIVARDTGLL